MLTAKKINDRLVVFYETLKDNSIVFCMQLVIGNKKAALIDAGFSKNPQLIKEIRKFTSLPVALYLTHGHDDHIGNASFFEEIHIGADDAPLLGKSLSYIPLSHGEKIDLGDVVLYAYKLSGHTHGGFCFLNIRDSYALTGDIINQETWLCWDFCDHPRTYAKKVLKFYEKLNEYGVKAIFEGHSHKPLTTDICADMYKALTEITPECAENDKMHHIENQKVKNQHSYGNSTIIYDKERIVNEEKFQNYAPGCSQ